MFDQAAIKELTKAEAITAAAASVGPYRDAVALPSDYEVHDLEEHRDGRRRARGKMLTSSLTDFARYAKNHNEAGEVFVDANAMAAVAVLNLGGGEFSAGHADNTATLALRKTAAYVALQAIANGGGFSQQKVAEFLEDWPAEIQCFNDQGEVPQPRAIAAVRQITIEGLRKVESTEKQLAASKSAFESIQASSVEPLPTRIYFTCIPYLGLTTRLFVLRLGVQTGDKPAITLRIVNAELHQEQMGDELAALVRDAIGEDMPVAVGTYTRGA